MENLRKCQGKSLPRSSQGKAHVVSMFFKAGSNGGVLSTPLCLCGQSSIRPPQGGYLQVQLTISRTVELTKEYSLPGAQNQTGAGHKYGLG